jgi:effector-binding domain-containing protein
MKILRILLIIMVIIVVVVGGLSFIAPTKMAASRSVVINAPKELVWNNVSKFENMAQWSPWAKRDPNMQSTIEGTDGTVGSKQSWSGNKEVGVGSQTIASMDPMNRIETKLDFKEPMEGHADAFTTLSDTAGGVKVTWGFSSAMARPFNIIGLFMDMDAAIGKDYEEGLANLKALCEQQAVAAAVKTYRGYSVSVTMRPEKTYIGKRETIMFKDISDFFGNNLPKIMNDVQKTGLAVDGVPSGIYYTYDTVKMQTAMAAAIPVKEVKAPLAPWETIVIPASKALALDYYGSYDKMLPAYQAIDDYIDEAALTPASIVIEEYVTGTIAEKDTAKWLTRIYYYVK